VLGDDVVIFDDKLLCRYLQCLGLLRVPISRHKSYSGDVVEFAGYVITKSRNSWTAFRPYKGERGLSSVLNVAHAVGAPIEQWGRYWANAYEAYRATLGKRLLDMSPIVQGEQLPQGSGLPGSKYFGSLFNRLSYSWTFETDPSDFAEAWAEERHILLKEEWSVLETREIFDSRSDFDPKEYVITDRLLKRATPDYVFSQDPLVAEYRQGRAAI